MLVNEIWDQYDDDGNGCLDREEVMNFVTDRLQEYSELTFNIESFDKIFYKIDKDKSGTIEKDEFIAFVKDLFYNMDTFKDTEGSEDGADQMTLE